MDNTVELFVLDLGKHMPVAFKVIHLLFFHFSNLFIDQLSINLIVRVVDTDMGFHLFLLLGRHDDSAILLACLDEANNLARVQVLMHTDGLQSSFLLGKALVVLHPLVKLSVLVIANMDEVFFGFKHLFLFEELVVVLNHICCCLLHIVQSDCQANYLKFLFVDASIVEDSLFVEAEELLLELSLDFNDLLSYALQIHKPLFTLLLDRVFEALLELLQALLLVFIHFFFRLVHPILTDQFFIQLVLFFFHNELVTAHHCLEATHANVVTL